MKRRTSALYDWTHQRRTKEDVCRNIIGESGLSVIEKERNGVDGFNKANSTIKSQIPLSRLERAKGWFGGKSPTIAPHSGRETSEECTDE